MKEREKCKIKKRAITDLNAPNGFRDIPFQSQEFGQDGHRHFVGFQPHFHLNMTSQTQCCKTIISNFVAMTTKIKIIVHY